MLPVAICGGPHKNAPGGAAVIGEAPEPCVDGNDHWVGSGIHADTQVSNVTGSAAQGMRRPGSGWVRMRARGIMRGREATSPHQAGCDFRFHSVEFLSILWANKGSSLNFSGSSTRWRLMSVRNRSM